MSTVNEADAGCKPNYTHTKTRDGQPWYGRWYDCGYGCAIPIPRDLRPGTDQATEDLIVRYANRMHDGACPLGRKAVVW